MPDMRVTVGADVKWVYSVLATLVPPSVVASTFAVPATPAGVVAVIVVAFTITTLVAGRPSSPSFSLVGPGDRPRRGAGRHLRGELKSVMSARAAAPPSLRF
jgi:hypothetical protein